MGFKAKNRYDVQFVFDDGSRVRFECGRAVALTSDVLLTQLRKDLDIIDTMFKAQERRRARLAVQSNAT